MKLGFTGSRHGMTRIQRDAFVARIIAPDEFHHGCCFGADEQAAQIVFDLGCTRIVGHPPNSAAMLSEFSLGLNTENYPPLPYLVRNKMIVDSCEVLLACPKEMEEAWRSGTWSTVRYGIKQGKKVVFFMPDGMVREPQKPDR